MDKKFEKQIKIFEVTFGDKYEVNPISRNDKDIVMTIVDKLSAIGEKPVSSLLRKYYKVKPDFEVLSDLLETKFLFEHENFDFIELNGEIINLEQILTAKTNDRIDCQKFPLFEIILNPIDIDNITSSKVFLIDKKIVYKDEKQRDFEYKELKDKLNVYSIKKNPDSISDILK